ncbi:MAG TPA: hypothetical protein P5539_05445 [Mesotoga sp.]|nr:hypothetical protein [Mesotoga sp.]
MAARVSFIPSFVNATTTFNFTNKREEQVVAFKTTRTGRDRVSAKVTIQAMHFDQASKSIKVFCSDGNLRECRVARLPSLEVGRQLWRQLQEIGKAGAELSFVAAGGFSPDKWFYTVE